MDLYLYPLGAFPGSISDKNNSVKSGHFSPQLWEPGDFAMADRGFPNAGYLSPLNVKLIIPSFLKGRDQLLENKMVLSQQIAWDKNPCRLHDTETKMLSYLL